MTRVNARLDRDLAARLLVVRERTGLSTSEVLKASLRAYLGNVEAGSSPAERLQDFVGSGKGPADLSARYKSHLRASLRKKHGG